MKIICNLLASDLFYFMEIIFFGEKMKKILILICVLTLLVFTACSPDVALQVGGYMGKLSGNVYGISANLKDVDTAVGTVDEAVSGTAVTLSEGKAEAIIASVVKVKESPTKVDALRAALTELLGTEVRPSLIQAAADAIITDTTGYDPARQTLAETVNAALAQVTAGLSENPTKAELVTVAALQTLAEAVKADTGYAEAGKAALDTLKISSTMAQLDILANISLTELVNGLGDRGASRGEGEADFNQYLPALGKTFQQLSDCLMEDGAISGPKYQKFLLECRAMKASYDFIAKDTDIVLDLKLSEQGDIDKGLTIEDLTHYLIAALVIKADEIVTDFTQAVQDLLLSIDFEAEDLEAQFENFDFDSLGFDTILDNNNIYFQQVLKTIGVILIDSGYQGLLELNNGNGTLNSFLNFLGE